MTFEQGPIRPPSEAMSVLVRVSRNCPWNRCAFCPVYKGEPYSRRPLAEVLDDVDALARFHGDAARTVFLQDADPLLTRPDDLLAILGRIRDRFPRVRRITTYARAKTLGRRSPEDLARIRAAGLTRVHVGLESGSDRVLALVDKGVTQAEAIAAGRKAVAAGFELCFYVMPGLGGRGLSEDHARETARVIREVGPHHVRLRTTAVAPGTPLGDLSAAGDWAPLDDVETVREIRLLLDELGDAALRFESDHELNLLLHLRGDLPADREGLLAMCDEFLDAPAEDRELFVLGRRVGRLRRFAELETARPELRAFRERIVAEGREPLAWAADLRGRWV